MKTATKRKENKKGREPDHILIGPVVDIDYPSRDEIIHNLQPPTGRTDRTYSDEGGDEENEDNSKVEDEDKKEGGERVGGRSRTRTKRRRLRSTWTRINSQITLFSETCLNGTSWYPQKPTSGCAACISVRHQHFSDRAVRNRWFRVPASSHPSAPLRSAC